MTQHSCSQVKRIAKFVLAKDKSRERERANHRRCLQEALLKSLKGMCDMHVYFCLCLWGQVLDQCRQSEMDGESERKAFFLCMLWVIFSEMTGLVQ